MFDLLNNLNYVKHYLTGAVIIFLGFSLPFVLPLLSKATTLVDGQDF